MYSLLFFKWGISSLAISNEGVSSLAISNEGVSSLVISNEGVSSLAISNEGVSSLAISNEGVSLFVKHPRVLIRVTGRLVLLVLQLHYSCVGGPPPHHTPPYLTYPDCSRPHHVLFEGMF